MDSGNWGSFINHYNTKGLTSLEEWELEKSFDAGAFGWFSENYALAFQLCGLYVIIVFGLQYYMEKRERFDLRKPLLCWSGFLAVFSIVGSIRCVISFIALYQIGGFRFVICNNDFYTRPVSRFWGLVFCLSKLPELVDTVFIVLRKQKLIFLHWYHHITVLLFSWYCYEGQRSGGAIFMTMNFIVHAMMYSYYALRAARYRVPRFIAVIVTTSQILQMVVGCLTFFSIYLWKNDQDCKSADRHILYGGLMYFSYFVLFCHFFYNSYLKPLPSKVHKKEVDPSANSVHLQKSDQGAEIVTNGSNAPVTSELRSRKNKQTM